MTSSTKKAPERPIVDWYKTAQETVDGEIYYHDIGHDIYYEEKEEGSIKDEIWIYMNGKVVSKPAKRKGNHLTEFGESGYRFWGGRYDEEKNILSVVPPETVALSYPVSSSRLVPIPESLKHKLWQKWPGAQIIGFGGSEADCKGWYKKAQTQDMFGYENFDLVGDTDVDEDPITMIQELIEYGFEDSENDEGVVEEINNIIVRNKSLNIEKVNFPRADSINILSYSGGRVVMDIEEQVFEDVNEWLVNINDDDLYEYIDSPDEDFKKNFWDGIGSGSAVYHGTSKENIESIKMTGLEQRQETNSLTNTSNGQAVYTSPIYETADYSYDVVVQIDLGLMKADGYTPPVSVESGVDEAEMRNSLAHMLGIEDYHGEDLEQGLESDTVLIYGEIPLKYLRFGDDVTASSDGLIKTATRKILYRFATEEDVCNNLRQFIPTEYAEEISVNGCQKWPGKPEKDMALYTDNTTDSTIAILLTQLSEENLKKIIEERRRLFVAKKNNWYRFAYSNENAWLRDYLKSGFDAYRHEYDIIEYMKHHDLMHVFDDKDPQFIDMPDDITIEDYERDQFEKWIDNANDKQIEELKEWMISNSPDYTSGHSTPHQTMSYKGYVKPTWLIHFTDHAQDISDSGFKYGHSDIEEGLAMTLQTQHEPGYNFAFDVDSRHVSGGEGKYGKEAVIFWSDGVEAHHHGDDEDQIMFWGPAVDTRMIFPIIKSEGEWMVEHPNRDNPLYGTPPYYTGDPDENFVSPSLDNVIAWVINNYRMLQNLHGKNKKGKKEIAYASKNNWYKTAQTAETDTIDDPYREKVENFDQFSFPQFISKKGNREYRAFISRTILGDEMNFDNNEFRMNLLWMNSPSGIKPIAHDYMNVEEVFDPVQRKRFLEFFRREHGVEEWEEVEPIMASGRNWYKTAQAPIRRWLLERLNSSDWEYLSENLSKKGYDSRGGEDAKRAFYSFIEKQESRAEREGEEYPYGEPGIPRDIYPDQYDIFVELFSGNAEIPEKQEEKQVDANDFLNAAEKEFGFTDNIYEAGYIMPDGTLLDFSEKKEGGPGGYRSLDHRAIERILPEEFGKYSEAMISFIKMGAIRCNFADRYASIDIMTEPTRRQYDLIRNIARDFDDFVIDVETSEGKIDLTYGTMADNPSMMRINGNRITNDISNLYNNVTAKSGNWYKMAQTEFEQIFRGEGGTSKPGGKYWSPSREWAAQFTQTGRESEVLESQIRTSDIYDLGDDHRPYAGDPDDIEEVVEEARSKGFKAVRLDEGINELPSVYVFDKSSMRDVLSSNNNWYKKAQINSQYTFIGTCDRVRGCAGTETDLKWNEMMKNAIPISLDEFLANCDPSEALDEDESIEEYINTNPDIEFFKSNFGSSNCYFWKTANFEFIWVEKINEKTSQNKDLHKTSAQFTTIQNATIGRPENGIGYMVGIGEGKDYVSVWCADWQVQNPSNYSDGEMRIPITIDVNKYDELIAKHNEKLEERKNVLQEQVRQLQKKEPKPDEVGEQTEMDLGLYNNFSSKENWYRFSQQYEPVSDAYNFEDKSRPYAPMFHGSLKEKLEQKIPNITNKNQIMQILNSPKLGIKKDEIEWSGLVEWVELKEDPIIKDDVLAFVDSGGVQIKETYPMSEPSLENDLIWDRDSNAIDPDEGYLKELEDEYHEDALQQAEEEADEDEWVDIDDRAEEIAREMAYETAQEAAGYKFKESNYGYYIVTDSSGDGYSLYSPDDDFISEEKELREAEKEAEEHATENYSEQEPMFEYETYTLEGGENYKELLFTLPNMGDGYSSSHWEEEENVFAHVRFKERKVDDKNTVFIEEIQSDWHQKGRESGYEKDIEKKKKILMDEKQQIDNKIDYIADRLSMIGYGQVSPLIGRDVVKRNLLYPYYEEGLPSDRERVKKGIEKYIHKPEPYKPEEDKLINSIKAISDEEIDVIVNFINNQYEMYKLNKATPAAPFSDTKAWTGLVFKRMLRWAAENNMDSIGWTTGQQQIERYNFQDYVDKMVLITLNGEDKDFYHFEAYKDNVQKHFERNVEESKISDLIGYELKARLFNKDPEKDEYGREIRVLEGDDFLIGKGSGMNTFYDNILPSVANKIGKKYNSKSQIKPIPLGYSNANGKIVDDMSSIESISVKASLEDPNNKLFTVSITYTKGKGSRYFNKFYSQSEEGFRNLLGDDLAQKLLDRIDLDNKNEALLKGKDLIKPKPKRIFENTHYFQITPEMKEDVLYKGQSLFAGKDNWYRFAQSNEIINNFPEYIRQNPHLTNYMEEFEEDVFKENQWFAQDAEDLYDDMIQPGVMGIGLENPQTGELNGYLYGYELISEDNFGDIEDIDLSRIRCLSGECEDLEKFIRYIYKEGEKGNIFYVANLAIGQGSRFSLHKMLIEISNQLKESKYEYIAFEGLPDTVRLLLEDGESIKKNRANRYGFEPICFLPYGEENDNRYLFLLKVLKEKKPGGFWKDLFAQHQEPPMPEVTTLQPETGGRYIQRDMFDPGYDEIVGIKDHISNALEKMKIEIYSFLEDNEEKIVMDSSDMEVSDEMVRERISEGDYEGYIGDEDKITLTYGYIITELSPILREGLDNFTDQSDPEDSEAQNRINEIEKEIETFGEWEPFRGYSFGYGYNTNEDLLEMAKRLVKDLGIDFEVPDYDDYLENIEGNVINDHIYEHNAQSVEEDIYSSNIEYYSDKLTELKNEFDFISDAEKLQYSDLYEEDLEDIESVFEHIMDDGFIKLQDEEEVIPILKLIKEMKYLCLSDEDLYRLYYLNQFGYSYEIQEETRKECKEEIDGIFKSNTFNDQIIKMIYDDDQLKGLGYIENSGIKEEHLRDYSSVSYSNYNANINKKIFDPFIAYLAKNLRLTIGEINKEKFFEDTGSYVGGNIYYNYNTTQHNQDYRNLFLQGNLMETIYRNDPEVLKQFLFEFFDEVSAIKDMQELKKNENISESDFLDYREKRENGYVIEDYVNKYKLFVAKDGLYIEPPEGGSIKFSDDTTEESIKKAIQYCTTLAQQKATDPNLIKQQWDILNEKEKRGMSSVAKYRDSFLQTHPTLSNEYDKIVNRIKEEKEAGIMLDTGLEYRKYYPNSPISMQESPFVKKMVKELAGKDRDENSIYPKLVYGFGLTTSRRDRSMWVRKNIPQFFREYNKEKAEIILKAFGRKDVDENRQLEGFAKFNRIPIEDLEIVESDFFGMSIKKISTGEIFTHNHPLPKFVSTWSESRSFGLGLDEHTVWTGFFDDNTINQPKLSQFLLGELYTDTSELNILLNQRGQAIEDKQKGYGGIIPGGRETVEDEMNPTYPDNKAGVREFMANKKINISGSKLENEALSREFASNLSQYGYGQDTIDEFFGLISIPPPEQVSIQPITKTINRFTFKILEKTDPLGSVLGNITVCCQKMGGEAENSMIDGYNNPNAGFCVAYDGEKIAAQSWIRLGIPNANGKRIFYFDNIETVRGYGGDSQLIQEYINFSEFLKSERDYEEVVCGPRYSKIDFSSESEMKPLRRSQPVEFPGTVPGVWSDLRDNQGNAQAWVLARNRNGRMVKKAKKNNWYKTAQKSYEFTKDNPFYNITESFKEEDVLTVYHGFGNFNEAYAAITKGLSGRDRVDRTYSFESNNNPFGLFVSLNRETVEEFTGSFGPAVIAEMQIKYSDLESPVWPGGSYTVQGQMSESWDWNTLEEDREKRRLENREDALETSQNAVRYQREYGKEPDHNNAIVGSDRPELAASLLGSEYQALFVGNLNPGDVKYVLVRMPREDGRQYVTDEFEKMSSEEFVEKFSDTELSRDIDNRIGSRIFLPKDEWNADIFVEYFIDKHNIDLNDLIDILKTDPNQNSDQYLWPKQVPGFTEWLSGFDDPENKMAKKTDWYKTARYGGSEETRGIWYHGTAEHKLPSIISQGLITDPKERTWGEDPDTGFFSPSRASISGVYLAKNLLTAISSSRKAKKGTEDSIIVICDIQERSLIMDEDDVSQAVQNAAVFEGLISTSEFLIMNIYFSLVNESNPSYVETAKRNYVENSINLLKYKFIDGKIHPRQEEVLKKIVEDNWIAALDRQAAHIAKNNPVEWKSYFFKNLSSEQQNVISKTREEIYSNQEIQEDEKRDKITEYMNDLVKYPVSIEYAESEYQKFLDQLTHTMKNVVSDQRNKHNQTARSENTIGFSGSNRIIGIVRIISQQKHSDKLVLEYGEIPEDFKDQYTEKVSGKSWEETLSQGGEAYSLSSSGNWYKTAQEKTEEEKIKEETEGEIL